MREDVATTAAELVRRNWAEANSGNLSFRLGVWAGRNRQSGAVLLTKQTGVRMRDLARQPELGLCRVSLDKEFRISSVKPRGSVPTSELASHIAVHRVLAQVRSRDRAVLHAHPTALVALSLLERRPEELVAGLIRMHSEGPVLIEDRVVAIPFFPPGSNELAQATARAFESVSAVIWPFHGMIASGPTLASALDLIELADKAADIALRLGERRTMGTGLSSAQCRAIRHAAAGRS